MSGKKTSPDALDEAALLAEASKFPEAIAVLDEGIRKARRQKNETSLIHLARAAGAFCEHLGRLDDAVHYYQIALASNRDDPFSHLALGAIYRKQGREQDARECFQDSYEAAVDSKDEEARQLLEKMGYQGKPLK